jgi:FkbM family methyltransferase
MKIITQREVYTFIKPYIDNNPTIVEVGAFVGHDTIRMAQQFPTSNIYAFEPVPELYEQLYKNTVIYAHVKTYPYAISDSSGLQVLYLAQKTNGKITQASSLRKPKERLTHSPIVFPREITVNAMTLPAWCFQEQVTSIDLLWLDTQGHEMAILNASRKFLPYIKTLYTEVGFIEAYEGQSHAHSITQWLIQEGFTPIAQDFTNQSTWFFGNMLFVRTDLLS